MRSIPDEVEADCVSVCLFMDSVKFVEPVHESFRCSYCHYVIQDPMQTDCGHRYCSKCVDILIRDGSTTCSNCGEEINVSEIHKDNFAKREINKLIVNCNNAEFGCPKQLPLSDLQKHLQICEYMNERCEACNQLIIKKALNNHKENECLLREVTCPLCQATHSTSQTEQHKLICPQKTITCICGAADLTREQVSQHLEICPEKSQQCSYSQYGCNFLGKPKDCEEHQRNSGSIHLDLFKKIVSMQVEMSKVETQTILQEAESKNQILEQQVIRITKENEAIVEQLNRQSKVVEMLQKSLASTMDKVLGLTEKSKLLAYQEQVVNVQQDLQVVKDKVKKVISESDLNSTNHFKDNLSSHSSCSNDKLNEQQSLLKNLDQQMTIFEIRLAETDLKFHFLEATSYNGILVWKITDYARRKKDACSGKCLSIYSQPFYSNRFGYKMCARVYLNGDGMGKGSHLSLFFVIMKGEHDELLMWPFRQRVTLMLLDQKDRKKHLTDAFKPDSTSSSFKKPSMEMNIASGSPLFILQQALESSDLYLKNDTIFIKVMIDTSDLPA